MKKPVRHLPRTWEKLTGIRIHDPDGWRPPMSKSFNAPIDEEEWKRRMIRSTVMMKAKP